MSSILRVGFCVSGGGQLCRAAIRNAALLNIEPAIVIAESKAQTDLEEFCASHRVPLVRLPNVPRPQFDVALEAACEKGDAQLFALTFDRLFPAAVVDRYRGRLVNMHPGLLPAFAGTRPLERALASGARFAGATMHEIDEGTDTGAVIAQAVLALRSDDTRDAVGARLFALMKPMYLQVLAWYAQGRVERAADGRLFVTDAVYGDLPIAPAIEMHFPD